MDRMKKRYGLKRKKIIAADLKQRNLKIQVNKNALVESIELQGNSLRALGEFSKSFRGIL